MNEASRVKGKEIFSEILESILDKEFEEFVSLDLADNDHIDHDILTNFLTEIDECFFGSFDDDGKRWGPVLSGSGQDLWAMLVSLWDGDFRENIDEYGNWVEPGPERI